MNNSLLKKYKEEPTRLNPKEREELIRLTRSMAVARTHRHLNMESTGARTAGDRTRIHAVGRSNPASINSPIAFPTSSSDQPRGSLRDFATEL